MKNKWMKIGLLLALVTLLVSGVAFAAPPQNAALERAAEYEKVVSQDVSLSEQQAAEALLTDEAIASAEALPMPALDEKAFQEEDFEADFIVGPTGPMEIVPGGLPEDLAALATEALEEDLAALATEALEEEVGVAAPASLWGYSYAPPFTRYMVNNYTNMWKYFPWRTMGKLYFQQPGSTSWYYCTASVMYGRAVWTAGHCVYTKGKGWHTNMTFVPAYRAGNRPYGTWTVYAKSTLSGWTQGKYAYDIGAVAVRDQSGKKISQIVGYLGAMWNASSIKHFHAFGLPSNIYSGKYLTCCAASTSRRDAQPGPDPLGIGCDMLHGSSGGPRLVKHQPYAGGANNYVNGVNSYYYTSKPKEVYAAYFGNGAKNLYNWGKSK